MVCFCFFKQLAMIFYVCTGGQYV
ncbi:hypothetical protein [Escherichia coli]